MTQNEKLQNLSPPAAYELLQEDPRALLIDIRSNMEFLFVGHPTGSVHIPWMDGPDWVKNPDFLPDVRQLLLGGSGEDSESPVPVILICRSGQRTVDAGNALIEAGIENVFHVDEGFEGNLDESHHRGTIGGWRFHGLPWKQC